MKLYDNYFHYTAFVCSLHYAETRVLFSETPSNPYLRILDVAPFAEISRRHKMITLIDAIVLLIR